MTKKEVRELLKRYETGQCTPEEEAFLEQGYINMALQEDMPPGIPDYDQIQKSIYANLPVSGPKKIIFPSLIRYAAALVIVASLVWAAYNNFRTSLKHESKIADVDTTQVLPGQNKATLTLANGQQIQLDNAKTGSIAQQAGTNIIKQGGTITYQVDSATNNQSKSIEAINTISIPAGGQYRIILPDQTVVYLNSESKLTYPSKFSGQTRVVTLTGEGYFEVTKNPGKPFIVNIANLQQLKVLGTHFNVSAYPHETIKTTLAEGSVQLTSMITNHLPIVLKPDQQATLLSNGFVVKPIRAKNQIAWKDGLFVFRQTPLPEALAQISRWYNVKAELQQIPNIAINADISKTQTLSSLLEVLKAGTGVNIIFTKERGLFFKP